MRILAIVPLLIATSVAAAGTIMQWQEKDLTAPKAEPTSQTFLFQDGAFRMERKDDDTNRITLFRDQVMYQIDPAAKTYRKLDKAQADQLADKMGQMRKMMEARMAQLPPEQRERMEAMMGGAGKTAAPQFTVAATGRSESVAGVSCQVMQINRGTAKEYEFCVAAPGTIPGGADMLKSMRDLASMMSGFVKTLGGGKGDSMTGYWSQLQQLNGVPILTRDFDSQGKVERENRLVAVKNESIPAALLQVPAGYTEKSMLGGLGAKGGPAE
jgi:Domain of unknown function (DUF4412)